MTRRRARDRGDYPRLGSIVWSFHGHAALQADILRQMQEHAAPATLDDITVAGRGINLYGWGSGRAALV